MAQASSAQREPSMEEILASIRRIIEDNDAGHRPQAEPETARSTTPAPAPATIERTVIEVDAFRNELRMPTAEVNATAQQKKPVTLAEVQAQITAEAEAMPSRWMDPAPSAAEKAAPAKIDAEQPYDRSPDDIKKAIENSRAAREDARALLGIPEPANTTRPPEPRKSEPARGSIFEERKPLFEERAQVAAPIHAAVVESASAKPALLSERVERQVAASFGELSEAFAARSRKTFDEMAEEMIAPLLRDWMENNLPTLVERLVREEIERVARGAQ